MRISQTVFGVFHHFELARQLERRGHLQTIYSTWPWQRLKREGLPHSKVRTFPWIHGPEMLLRRSGYLNEWLYGHLGYTNALSFDRWTDRQLAHDCQALIAISGSSLKAGLHLQQRGGLFICDSGSTHQRYQEQIVFEELRRWGVEDVPVSDHRDTLREEAIYAVADAITVASRAAQRSFVAMGVDAAKIHVIPYGVRLENFSKTSDPAPDRFEVLFAGQASLRKGIPYLLDAFSRLNHPNKRLTIAGQVQPDLQELLSRLPMEHVELLGSIPQPELAARMSRSHLLVLPSIEEGLALVQAQAMACGCPVLATTHTGAEDLFTDGVEGFIVPIRDANALLARMEELAQDPELQQSMSEAGLRRVRELGGWDRYGDLWESLLSRLVQPQAQTSSQS
jgi:glycosyltransferase involved in cell wall biosynthesis